MGGLGGFSYLQEVWDSQPILLRSYLKQGPCQSFLSLSASVSNDISPWYCLSSFSNIFFAPPARRLRQGGMRRFATPACRILPRVFNLSHSMKTLELPALCAGRAPPGSLPACQLGEGVGRLPPTPQLPYVQGTCDIEIGAVCQPATMSQALTQRLRSARRRAANRPPARGQPPPLPREKEKRAKAARIATLRRDTCD
jgi:hypothetical protein